MIEWRGFSFCMQKGKSEERAKEGYAKSEEGMKWGWTIREKRGGDYTKPSVCMNVCQRIQPVKKRWGVRLLVWQMRLLALQFGCRSLRRAMDPDMLIQIVRSREALAAWLVRAFKGYTTRNQVSSRTLILLTRTVLTFFLGMNRSDMALEVLRSLEYFLAITFSAFKVLQSGGSTVSSFFLDPRHGWSNWW